MKSAQVKTPDGKVFYEGMELKKSEDGLFHCEKCGQACKNKYNLVQHIKFLHLGLSGRKERLFQSLQLRKVNPEVVKEADGSWSLKGIQLLEHEDGQWSCGKCGHKLKNKYNLAWHVKVIHLGMKTVKRREKRVVQGPKTLKQLNTAKTVKTADGRQIFEGIEIASAEGTGEFKCPKCVRTYKSKHILKAHIKKRHLPEGNFYLL
jgi:uncharacterized C2H2 Zn-finger protein